MKKEFKGHGNEGKISRRRFIQVGGAAIAGSTLPLASCRPFVQTKERLAKETTKITRFRTLGRTGFNASDISLGCGGISDANVIRYAYDHGINYFDTAESYGNGASETAIGEAMAHMDRKKIFITTKLKVDPEKDTEQTLLDRFGKCLERLKTGYADALYTHAIQDVTKVSDRTFHAVVKRLKSDGKLKHAGISSHGPRSEEGDSLEEVLVAAAEDGRFDLMLFTYNFLNKDAAEKVIEACKKRNIGTTAMKIMPAHIGIRHYDPENPQEETENWFKYIISQGGTREEAIERINQWADQQMEEEKKARPFMNKHGITTNDELKIKSIQWVLRNPEMHTVCVSMNDFESIDRMIPLSGTELSRADAEILKDWEYAYGKRYCRHGCVECMPSCPSKTPVSTIMRYSYYFDLQGREKYAMKKYARLDGRNASSCLACSAPCVNSCPHGVNVPANMVRAHMMLTMV